MDSAAFNDGAFRAQLLMQTFIDHGAAMSPSDGAECMAHTIGELMDTDDAAVASDQVAGFCSVVVLWLQTGRKVALHG